MRVRYQCWVCGKLYETEEAAGKCHDGPTQGIYQHVTRDPYRGFFGTKFRKAKKQ
jgi:hypothetical protein